MQNELSCPLCTFEFSDQKIPRIISMCGHTFCEQCLQTLIVPNSEGQYQIICPQDDLKNDIQSSQVKQFPVNKVLLKIVESNKSKSSFKDSSFDVSKIVKQQELQEDEETKQLISAIQQSQQQESELEQQKSEQPNPTQINNSTMHTQYKKDEPAKKEEDVSEESEEDENICLLHQKPLEVVCVVDLEKICAKCALFGKHKGHDFKSLEQIEQQNNAFYHQILAVYDEKTIIVNRVQKKQTKTDLLAILNANKENLSKQIKEKFKKLLDAIKLQEKKALTKLDKLAQKIEKEIDESYKIEPYLIEKYEEWQRLSFEKLQIIEKGTFEQKLELLLVQQADNERNIIIQGNALVEKIKNQQDDILARAEVFLTNINMRSSDKIFQFVESFVQVYDRLPDPPKVQLPKKVQQPAVSPKQEYRNQLLVFSGKKNSEDDLLDIGDNESHEMQPNPYLMEFKPRNEYTVSAQKQDNHKYSDNMYIPVLPMKIFDDKPAPKQETKVSTKRSSEVVTVEELKKKAQIPQESIFLNQKQQDSFSTQKVVRPPKKKLKTIKVPQKYEKVLDALYADNSQTLDLTNAQLGDSIILQICEFIPGTKLKTIKFIRNKLSDDCVLKMLPYLGNSITLNLSQNLLTERVLDIFIDNRELLPKVKNIILSLNKIIERKHKNKIDELRKFDITVSV